MASSDFTGAPNTGSVLSYNGGGNGPSQTSTNRTSTALSTNILIMVGPNAVGAVQKMSVAEKRTHKFIDEVGTDGHIDSAPNASTNITGSCQRVRFDRLRIAQAFSRGFIHVSSQAYPFDIVVLDKQTSNVANQITTVIKNVWISNISYDYNHNDWIITETMDWEAEAIFSFLSGSTSPVAAAGGLNINPVSNITIPNSVVTLPSGVKSYEQLADTGSSGRRGSLDLSGIIDIAAGAW
jgi:hypothetical protein